MLPLAIPVTTPETASTDPMAALLEDQVPPPSASVSVVELPTQTFENPLIADGTAFTVNVATE